MGAVLIRNGDNSFSSPMPVLRANPSFRKCLKSGLRAQNPELVDKRCRLLELLHQGALHRTRSSAMMCLTAIEKYIYSRITSSAQRLGHKSRDNLSKTYAARKPTKTA